MKTTLEDVEDKRFAAIEEEKKYLREHGWTHSSTNPACIWLWEKKLADGRVALLSQDTAMFFQKMTIG